jgi:hypothetical protein
MRGHTHNLERYSKRARSENRNRAKKEQQSHPVKGRQRKGALSQRQSEYMGGSTHTLASRWHSKRGQQTATEKMRYGTYKLANKNRERSRSADSKRDKQETILTHWQVETVQENKSINRKYMNEGLNSQAGKQRRTKRG